MRRGSFIAYGRWRPAGAVLLAVAAGIAAASCGAGAPAPPPAATADAGAPLPGLSAVALARFRAGEALFNRVFTPAAGLGPAFNENQCSACHTSPTSGGAGGERVEKSTRFDPATGCDLLRAEGGENIRTRLTAMAAAAGLQREREPADARMGRFTAAPLYGLGLVEAIPDAALQANADPDDANRDGVSGVVGRTSDGRVARFGRKADIASIADFVASAAHFEMGLTTPTFPRDVVQGQAAPPAADPVPDPELGREEVDLLVDYVRLLAPPRAGLPRARHPQGAVDLGERQFAALGCVGCHVPVLNTGAATEPALERRQVTLYSDLLLHDLGEGLADICAAGAAPSELRTAPLMGLRLRELLLHDGRVTSVREAILRHGGEAAAARERFRALRPGEQEALLAFLETL
jgi:CxxC motif-containing protein (DUF1111 family)